VSSIGCSLFDSGVAPAAAFVAASPAEELRRSR
jgi:hypothetical protein